MTCIAYPRKLEGISCSSSRLSIRPGPRAPVSSSLMRHPLDVEELDVLGVLLDELATRLDRVAHQHGERAVGGGRIFDVDAHQQTLGRIHRRLPELLRVHLAEALEA